MSDLPPLILAYDGESFTPATPHWQRVADQHYVIGETYRMGQIADRSQKSHNHFFAAVTDAWRNLPDDRLEEFPTAEHLRKKALIRKGYADERTIVCASKAEAQRIAAFIRPMDEYAIVVCREATVTVFTAQSQSVKAMGKAAFQQSKEAVFAYLDFLLGLDAGVTKREAGRAA